MNQSKLEENEATRSILRKPHNVSPARETTQPVPSPEKHANVKLEKKARETRLSRVMIDILLGKMSSSEALKCLNWLPLAVRRLSHRCTAVENAIKGNIPQHFESFKSALRSSHGYNTRNGYLPRLPKAKTECGRRVSYFRFLNDWMSLPAFLRKPMLCAIFKKNLTNFLMDNYL